MKFIKQKNSNDCGLACILMILSYYGSYISLNTLNKKIIVENDGISAYSLVKCLNKFNFDVTSIKTDKEYFSSKEYIQKPMIAHVILDNKLQHYIIIEKYKNGKLYVLDPSNGKQKMTIETFNNIWTGILFIPSPNEKYKKIKEKNYGLWECLPLIIKNKKYLFLIIFLSTISAILSLISAYYFQILLDMVLPNKNLKLLYNLFIVMIGIYCFQIFFQYLKEIILIKYGQLLSSEIIKLYFKKIIYIPLNYFNTYKTGDFISRFSESERIINTLISIILSIILDTSLIVGIGSYLFLINKILFSIIIVVILLYSLIMIIFNKKLKKYNSLEKISNEKLTSLLIEAITCKEVILTSNRQKNILNNINLLFNSWIEKNYKLNKVESVQRNIKLLIQTLSIVVILSIGSYMVINSKLLIGQLITYNMMVTIFFDFLQKAINFQNSFQEAQISYERIKEIFLIKEENIYSGNQLKVLNQYPVFKITNLSYEYFNNKNILNNISLTILKHQWISIVGESGTGKSTLVKILSGLYPYNQGNIKVYNQELSNLSLLSIRKNICYVSQNTQFFSGTVLSNLLLDVNIKISDEIIKNVCDIVNISIKEDNNDLSLFTIIEENGNNLSGGQKQRINLARALLLNPRILILDEFSSAMDSKLEDSILKHLKNIEFDAIIFIAHRLNISKYCDQIIVLDNGKIKEIGTHTSLLNKNGKYHELWKYQNQ